MIIKRLFIGISLLISIFFSIVMAVYFMTGFHNVDLGFNGLKSEEKVKNIGDMGTDGVIRPLVDYYLLGMVQMRRSFVYEAIILFFVGYIVSYIFHSSEGEDLI